MELSTGIFSRLFAMLHPPTALGTLPEEYCLGPVDPTTMPAMDEIEMSEEEISRQEARDEMPEAESMLLLSDFEVWAERVLSNVAWAYYRSASDHEACMSACLSRCKKENRLT